MSDPYRPATAQHHHHAGNMQEVCGKNPKNENHQQHQSMMNDWLLDMATDGALRGHGDGCHAKYEELKKHRIEIVQYLGAMRGWAMETTKTIRRLEKRTMVAEKEAAASKAEVLRLQELLSKTMARSREQDAPKAAQKKRRRQRKESDDSHASSVQ